MKPAPASRSAVGPLRALVAFSLVLPAALFGFEAWLNYRSAVAAARNELLRTSEIAREHAEKVFGGQSQVADRIKELVRGMDAAAIRRSEAELHADFARIVAHLPAVQSVLLADQDGIPLVSAKVYPIPVEKSLKGRDFFEAIMGGNPGTYVSEVQLGRILQELFFGLARPWIAADGTVRGVIDVAVSPYYFQDFYKALISEDMQDGKGSVITLVRDDGQVLVRYPPFAGRPPRAPSSGPFLTSVRAQPDEGMYESQSLVDPGVSVRTFAYRRVTGWPVYVVAGRSRDAVFAEWRATMAGHLVFGIPATLALFAVTWTALVRTRREKEALAVLRQEVARRETAEAALLKAQRLEAVGQMTGGIAHDFNNLLTVIGGSAETLDLRAGDPERVRRIAAQIMMAARRGGEVTQKLLAFSRRQVVRPEIINLNRCLQEFQQLLSRAASEAVEVKLELDAGLDPVRLDPGHFEAAILNLVGNARDAMPEGGCIVIATRNIIVPASESGELPPGAYVRVAVSDSGSGMDQQTAAKAFEPFFTTKDVGKGTGLGLSQVYGFAKQAGGDVRILTRPGAGTTVELVLPRSVRQSVAPVQAADALPVGPASDGEVVLVVEDDPGVLELTAESLGDLGYHALPAANAAEALEILAERRRIDVLFSDVVMPGGMNGVQLAVEARRLRPALRVLLTSGYTGNVEGRLPDIPLLTKPYNRTQLARHLRDVLKV